MSRSTKTTSIKCAIYARVSKREGHPENQLRELRRFASATGWTVQHSYIDRQTGATLERPQLAKMLEDADRRKFDVVLFWRFDRLTRTGILDTLDILRKLDAAGVGYHSYTEPHIRSTGPMGALMVAFIATVAELEREANRERTLAGLERAKQEGKTLGRPRRIVDVEKLRKLRAQNLTTREIARRAGVSPATVERRLRAPRPA